MTLKAMTNLSALLDSKMRDVMGVHGLKAEALSIVENHTEDGIAYVHLCNRMSGEFEDNAAAILHLSDEQQIRKNHRGLWEIRPVVRHGGGGGGGGSPVSSARVGDSKDAVRHIEKLILQVTQGRGTMRRREIVELFPVRPSVTESVLNKALKNLKRRGLMVRVMKGSWCRSEEMS